MCLRIGRREVLAAPAHPTLHGVEGLLGGVNEENA